MIDADGYRANVAIVLCNSANQVLWARRCGMDAWQFPQGGIQVGETAEQAMYRELHEELGLRPDAVQLIGCTDDWLRYELPKRYQRRRSKPLCIGQKQIWFILRLVGREADVKLDCCRQPEFDCWRWVDYWLPLEGVVEFKRAVYQDALTRLAPLVLPEGARQPPA